MDNNITQLILDVKAGLHLTTQPPDH